MAYKSLISIIIIRQGVKRWYQMDLKVMISSDIDISPDLMLNLKS